MEVKYYICKHCGNIVEKVKDKKAWNTLSPLLLIPRP